MFVCCLILVNMTQTRITWEEKTLIEELPPSDWLVGKSEGSFMTNDNVAWAGPWKASCARHGEQVSKQQPSWPVLKHLRHSLMVECNPYVSLFFLSLPQVAFGQYLVREAN